MSEVFGTGYAAVYDLLYADKDYDAECDLIEQAFRDSGRPVRTVLDLGCGTGAHTVRLAQRGYDVVGVDISAGMLAGAHRRAADAGVAVRLVESDIRDLRLDSSFDAVICMFAVLGYQTTDLDVMRTLATVNGHLVAGGPFLFDVWYGPAVERLGPSSRVKTVHAEGRTYERHATGALEPQAHLCAVSYRLVRLGADGEREELANETHRMRYFFLPELGAQLSQAGLSVRRATAFPDTDLPPSEESWNALVLASKEI